ncbi:AmmeMemoRadiSam system protein A [Desulfonauticus submarinus]
MQEFTLNLSPEEKKYLKEIAKLSILEKFSNTKTNYPKPCTDQLEKHFGAFVTLKKNGNLRGCIGQIIGQKPLWETIIEMAKAAAFEDPRFPALQPSEINDIEIEISILSPFKKIKNIQEINPGQHGLFIQKGYYSGLLLPQVATEWNWDKKTFLEHTCLKAGLNPDCYKDPDTDIYVFEAIVF